jgi:uncharacterized protein YjbJ (UPF0337 family)
MNWSTINGSWNEAKGQIKSVWARLTDDDLMQVQGEKDRLIGVIQQKYGITGEQAEEQLEQFIANGDGWITKAKEGAQDLVDKGREYIDKGVERGREYARRGSEYMQKSSRSQMASDLTTLIGRHPIPIAIFGIGLGLIIGRYLTPSTRS